jgi:hypothetical protein
MGIENGEGPEDMMDIDHGAGLEEIRMTYGVRKRRKRKRERA